MTRFFERGTAFAEMERQMMMVPNFAPRGCGSAVLCRYHPTAADVDCRNCLEHRRRGCRSLTCLYLSERLEAGAVTMDELIAETVRPWKHLPLKQRAMGVACRMEGFHFDGQLHIMRMMEMAGGGKETANSRWLAAVYLLSAHACRALAENYSRSQAGANRLRQSPAGRLPGPGVRPLPGGKGHLFRCVGRDIGGTSRPGAGQR